MCSDDELRTAIAGARDALTAAISHLDKIGTAERVTEDDWQDASAAVGLSMALHRENMARVGVLLGLGGAQKRLLRYLLRHVGQVVSGPELSGVAGIAEWPRRIRELRVEEGWPIESGVQRSTLRPDEYILLRGERDEELARKWQLASDIRRSSGTVRDRILAFLKAVSPQAADRDDLEYVAKSGTWKPAIGDLRDEGWDIRSADEDPQLAPGSYRLLL
ncbi:biotin operon repressor [Kibdelosporangium banguiense]|uniref:Biotin operon repressor n=1 Tax=Kibdelosporangium banguiense TaxID=1365924 RepID=A0ABS4TF99_9PSEU|nr:hypothetical protein [Kibdelosporangium banguiense]MBP2323044.1 biotin operon repressor [Kibdelosporangium banguiense]